MTNNREKTFSRSSVDDRLQRIANVLLLNASFIDNPGLLNGKMGIAIFFYQYSRYTNNKIYEEYAGELIDEIYEEINKNTPVNFENGLTGIGWGIEYLVKNKFVQADTDEALAEIDTTVYRNSLYRPFLLETGNDIFGYGLYYLIRLTQHGDDDDNLNTLFKKQHLIYLTDDCERILIQKKYIDFNIKSLSVDAVNSFSWFLLEMYKWKIFPFKVEKLFHALPEYFESLIQNPQTDMTGIDNMLCFIDHIGSCVKDSNVRDIYINLSKKSCGMKTDIELTDENLINSFTKSTWQRLIYAPYIQASDNKLITKERIFEIIDNEENWNNRIDTLNKNNLGLSGLAGLGLLMAGGRGQGAEGKGLRAQGTQGAPPCGVNSATKFRAAEEHRVKQK